MIKGWKTSENASTFQIHLHKTRGPLNLQQLNPDSLLGSKEKRRDRKTRKSRSEVKMIGYSSASLFPAKKWEVLPGWKLKVEDNLGNWYCYMFGRRSSTIP